MPLWITDSKDGGVVYFYLIARDVPTPIMTKPSPP